MSLELASRRLRISAFFIDHITLCLFGAVAAFLAMGQNWDQTGFDQMNRVLPIVLAVFVLFFAKDSVAGMSPGRFILGIAVREHNAAQNVPGHLRMALRNVLIAAWPIEFLVLVFSKQKRRLGDLIAKTIVVKRDDIPGRQRAVVFVSLALLLTIVFAATTPVILKRSSAYPSAIAYLEKSPEIQGRVGNITGYGMFPSGGLQVQNGYGLGQLEMKVIGDKGSVTVHIKMEKEPESAWEIKETVLEGS